MPENSLEIWAADTSKSYPHQLSCKRNTVILVVSEVLDASLDELGLDATIHGVTHQRVESFLRFNQQSFWQLGLHEKTTGIIHDA